MIELKETAYQWIDENEERIIEWSDKVWKFEGKAKVNGKVVAESVYTAMVMEGA